MKKFKIILFLCIIVCNYVFAVPVDRTPRKVIQPNGDTIYIHPRGDEFGAWIVDDNGDVIAKNSEGYWVYVAVENGKKILTSQIVTKTSIPININRDSVFNYIREKRTASYLRKSIYRKTRAGGSNSQLHLLPSKGNRKILTVLVQFPDVHFQNTTGIKTIISNMMNQENYRHIGQSRITGS